MIFTRGQHWRKTWTWHYGNVFFTLVGQDGGNARGRF